MQDEVTENPYESPRSDADADLVSAGKDEAVRPGRGGQLVGAWLLIAGVPFYIACGSLHICMAGHMHHPPYAVWHYINDAVWVVCIAVGAFVCWSCRGRWSTRIVVAGIVLWFSRLALGSGGGLLFLVELPLIVVIACGGASNLRATMPSERPTPSDTPQDSADLDRMVE